MRDPYEFMGTTKNQKHRYCTLALQTSNLMVRIRKRPTNSQTNCTSPSIEVLTYQHLIEGADTGSCHQPFGPDRQTL